MPEPTHPSPGGKPAWRAYRSRHRHDQDNAAHAEDFVPTPSIDHPLVPDEKPTLITDDDALLGLIDTLRAAGSFGYDTEFIGENTYYPHLCLIQAGTADTLALIDPFAVDDLTPWWELLADASVEKLVHAGEQDLEPVQRILGRPAANVFDSQIAAGFAGLPYPLSLVKLVDAILDAQLDAGAKFSKWDRRPLTEQQKHYAANDVRYLPAIREALRARLADAGNTDWARQACAELCVPDRYTPDPLKRKVKAKGVNQLAPKKRSVLNTLICWREEVAKADNLPPRAMIPDEAMMQLATSLPAGPEQLRAIKFLPRPVRERYEAQMLTCIREGLVGPHPPRPKAQRYDRDEHRDRVNAMWDRVAEHCEAKRIDPAGITSKRELGRLVAARMEGQPTPDLPCTLGWRAALLGDTTAPQPQ
ncbi:MAG: ribonuclease D [Phycisphaerales bacterium JB063]